MRVHVRMEWKHSLFCILVATSLLVAGCRSKTPEFIKPYRGMSSPDTNVTLMPGDLLDIKFFYAPELNETQQIRADGKITLQLAGDITAAGLNPYDLKIELEKTFQALVDRPSAAVIVREMNKRKVYIGGAVNTPGVIEMPGNMTALDAIMQAGGFNMKEADLEQIVVLRREGATSKSYCLNLRDALDGKTPHAPFYLHAQDIVYIQRTGVVKTGQWINQHINQLVPQFGFTYFYNTGTKDSTIGLDTSSYR